MTAPENLDTPTPSTDDGAYEACLRDLFAGQALAACIEQGFKPEISTGRKSIVEWATSVAYRFADEMLIQRAKGQRVSNHKDLIAAGFKLKSLLQMIVDGFWEDCPYPSVFEPRIKDFLSALTNATPPTQGHVTARTNEFGVTQVDRDAAANYLQAGSNDGHAFAAMRTSQCDNHPLVQAFAAHRIVCEDTDNAKIVALAKALLTTPTLLAAKGAQ